MTVKLKDSVQNLSRACSTLHEALAEKPRSRITVSAIIKNFEFCYELSWKSLKRYLEFQGIVTNSPRESIAEAFRNGFIADEMIWLKMIKDRNLTVHTYDETLAKEMVQHIEDQYAPIFLRLLDFLSKETASI